MSHTAHGLTVKTEINESVGLSEFRDRHEDEPDQQAVDDDEEMPENYIFKGWLAFALHGWIVPPEMEENKSQLIHASTELKSTSALGKKKHGRAQSRKEKSEKKKQELIAAPSDDGRGTTLAQKMQYAGILHTRDLVSMRQGDKKLNFA